MVLDATDGSDPDTLGDFTTETKYTWGLDLSGTLHGAGGVGGLLEAVEVGGATGGGDAVYYFFNDANGNVTQVIDVTANDDPKQVAHYEYDPYGRLIHIDNNVYDRYGNYNSANGYAYDNPFRFSTKWLDDELASTGQTGAVGEEGLYYYGYRYLSTTWGRWLNEDPIEEQGGMNLYAFVGNDPVGKIDKLGLASEECCYCGPDITAWLAHEMVEWYHWVNVVNQQIPTWAAEDAPWYEPDFVRAKNYQYAFLALVGKQMTYFPRTKFHSKECPTSPECDNTVTLSGVCIHTSEVGNLVFGAVARFFKMTWIQTWAGSIVGSRGERTAADAAGVSIGYEFGGEGGVIGQFLAGIDPKRLQTLGADAPPECKPCQESVAAAQNHVQLPVVTPTWDKRVTVTLPTEVHE
jgi:RHS repeat-associated protein